jgi:membrane fusion protein (multidrug efflux system)
VYAIEPEVAAATRTLQVRAITDNKNGKLLPGTFADVELPLDIKEDAIVVPTYTKMVKKFFISSNGQTKEVMIETATRTDASILVLSGLKAGIPLLLVGVSKK